LLTGRRRYGPLSRNQICNSPIQGTMAEIVIDAMNRISELDLWDIQPILNIHDDLGFHVLEELAEDYMEIILAEMLKPTFDFINVPLMVEMSIGKNLFDMHEVGKFRSDEWYGYTQESGWKGKIAV
jgi:DNA polymerase I-like protein with 3'-5' exonuclease and polymerase domains